MTHHVASKSRGVRHGRTSNPPGSRSGIGFPSRVINRASYSWSSSRPSRGDWDLLEVSHLASLLIGLGRTTLAILECIKNMSTISGPVGNMLMTVKSREVQRGMLAEMRGDRPAAARHFLAAAHLKLVLAADFDEIGDADLAVRSRLSTASCFWRGPKTGQVRYWQYGQAEKSPDLAISDLSRFLPAQDLSRFLPANRRLKSRTASPASAISTCVLSIRASSSKKKWPRTWFG